MIFTDPMDFTWTNGAGGVVTSTKGYPAWQSGIVMASSWLLALVGCLR